MKNWLGLDAQPSDSQLHWRDSKEDAHKLRKAWDSVVAAGQLENLELIINQARQSAARDESDSQCGADI